jgi:hypothetical protein
MTKEEIAIYEVSPDRKRAAEFNLYKPRLDTTNDDPLLDRKSAAAYISFAPATLANWDCNGRFDLKPFKIGRSVRYRRSVLDEFLDSKMRP